MFSNSPKLSSTENVYIIAQLQTMGNDLHKNFTKISY